MRVVVASLNPAKLDAARQALALAFPQQPCQLEGVSVPSGVAEQPVGDEETRRGAHNRALAARTRVPEADLWIGMEGGVEQLAGQTRTFAWMQVLSPAQDNAARSASLTLPAMVADALSRGDTLGEAMDRLFRLTGCGRQGGAIGVLTGNLLDRRSLYRDTLILALAPWLSPAAYGLPATETSR